MKRKVQFFTVVVVALLLAVAGIANTGKANAFSPDAARPAGGNAFSLVSEHTGDIETDLVRRAQELRDLGFSETEIQEDLAHLRPALEKSKYGVAETLTFSVVVDGRDADAYAQALREQGLSEDGVRSLTAQFARETAALPLSPAGGCKTRTDGAVARNAFGQTLYRYSSSIYWCFDGSKITALDTWESHSTYWGWQFKGSTHNSSGGLGQWEYALHRRATMYQPWLGLYAHPDTHQRVYGNGSS